MHARSALALLLAASAAPACRSSNGANSDGGAIAIGCAAGPDAGGGYDPQIAASDFSASIDNRFYPLVPGTAYSFRDSDGNLTVTTVTTDIRPVMGVMTRVVHDKATAADGTVIEDTFDWFAQDRAGNVWYFGEDTTAYSGNQSSKKGSWEAGVDCAKPGIIMKASPAVGDSYRQEFRAGVAEDRADVLSLTESVTVPYGQFASCLMTRDYSDLEPGMDEHKIYCAGVGLVTAIDLVTVGTGPREDLIAVTQM